ncbi:MAG: class I SAM-dependent methyltransferase [Thermoleophilia bacterium]|nr:class I SAM-dependent methyltransferase [Thermoleophilia bacterium]
MYDRIGRFQDWQTFYEGPAVGDLIAHVHLDSAGERLQRWAGRARVRQTDGSLPLAGADGAYSHVLAVYVFDLLSEDYARAVLRETARLLGPGGRVGVVSLTPGRSGVARLVGGAWGALWELAPWLTGGCRPVHLGSLLEPGWVTEYRAHVEAWGVASEVHVATPAMGA